MLSRLRKTNKLHTMKMIFVIAIATATCDCNEDSYALLVSFDNWPEDVTKYLEQEKINDKYKKESGNWYDIPYSSIISRGQSTKIKFEARDGLGCTVADHEATIEIPFWPRQWVRVKVPWNKLAYPQCPPEWPSSMITRVVTGHNYQLNAVWIDNKQDIWVGGGEGCSTPPDWNMGKLYPAAIINRENSNWIQKLSNSMESGSECVTGGWASSDGEMWAVGWRHPHSLVGRVARIYHYKDASTGWTREEIPQPYYPCEHEQLSSIWASKDIVVAVGNCGIISKGKNDNKWSRNPIGSYYGVWGSTGNDIWIVGGDRSNPSERSNPIIRRRIKDDWERVFPPEGVSGTLYGIWGTGANNIWAVGERGMVIYWNGTKWEIERSGTTQTIHAVWADRPNSAWAVGDEGTILFRDRWQWNPVHNTIGRDLHSVIGNESTVWIGGDMGTTLSIQRCTDVSCRPR